MFGLFRRLAEPRESAKPSVPNGLRVYAIGDVHGCRAELDELLDMIESDRGSATEPCHLVFLGDLVDRGPDSAGVIDRLQRRDLPCEHVTFLAGNHEEAMLQIWDGDSDAASGWLRYGGIQTLESYGLTRSEVFKAGLDLPKRMHEVIPAEHIDFLKSFKDQVRLGDYLFVHAGVRPGVDLDRQEGSDLRWIREDFLSDERDHGAVIVHGHTISEVPEFRPNRIGIDTGCYASGRLTALVLEGAERRLLQTGTQ